MKTRIFKTLLALASCLAPLAHAQDYPTRPITLIVPYAAGGITDVAFRTIAAEAAKTLGQPVVVENRVGAAGKIGARAVMAAPKDGYTLGVFNSGVATNLPLMDPSFAVEPGKDYTPITRAIETYVVLVASPQAPFRDVRSMLEFAKANPRRLTIGSSGLATTGHLGVELLRLLAKVDVVHVPYRGETPAMSDVVGGQIHAAFLSGVARPMVTSGKVVGIAVSGARRWDVYPELPSLQEAGVQRFAASAWQGIVGPAGLPEPVVARLNTAFQTALRAPAVRASLEKIGLDIMPASTPEEFGTFIRKDLDYWRPVVKAANLKME